MKSLQINFSTVFKHLWMVLVHWFPSCGPVRSYESKVLAPSVKEKGAFVLIAHVSQGGVRRVHLLDSNIQGALLLELYTRDGIGTMVSRYCSLALWFLLLHIFLCISNSTVSNSFCLAFSLTMPFLLRSQWHVRRDTWCNDQWCWGYRTAAPSFGGAWHCGQSPSWAGMYFALHRT
jgi:hypothetical protein